MAPPWATGTPSTPGWRTVADVPRLLGAQAQPLGREGDAVGAVLPRAPARTQPELDPAAGHVVARGDLDGEHARLAEGRRRHQGAQADPGRLPGDPGECRPGVGRP